MKLFNIYQILHAKVSPDSDLLEKGIQIKSDIGIDFYRVFYSVNGNSRDYYFDALNWSELETLIYHYGVDDGYEDEDDADPIPF